MSRFLVIGFDFYTSFYYALILCKTKNDYTEYRITVMHGDIEKQLCNNNIIREVNGCLYFELSGNKMQDQLKTEIAKALGKIIGKPLKEIALSSQSTGEQLLAEDFTTVQKDKTSREHKKQD